MTNTTPNLKASNLIDKSGIIISLGCILHCAMLPLAIVFAPILWWERYDFYFWILAFVLSALSTFFVIKTRDNNKKIPIICASIAWLWALIVVFLDLSHTTLLVSGIFLLLSHLYINHANKKRCAC